MIIGLILNNYKAYSEPVYVPMSNGFKTTGIIGENGVGKSSVLEALNTFFNDYKWQYNHVPEKEEADAYMIFFFLFDKSRITDTTLSATFQNLSDTLWKISESRTAPIQLPMPLKPLITPFTEELRRTIKSLPSDYDKDKFYIVPILKRSKNALTPEESCAKALYHYLYIPPQYEMCSQPPSPLHARYPFTHMSPGEKAEALVPLIRDLLNSDKGDNYIIAFDEPETALQISACYDYFETIYNLNDQCAQLLVASHWYGFIPMLTSGLLVDIVYRKPLHQFLTFDIGRFREEIKINKRLYREKYKEELPIDIMLKTSNDFIQSLLGGVTNDVPYNWLICEGSSEKIIFDYYFSDLIQSAHLRIIPVGGIREIKKLYNYLAVAFKDLEEYIHGKIVLLTDTDAQMLEFDTSAIRNLYCYRLINERGETHLVHIKANPKSPATELEDALNGRVFDETLQSFQSEYPKLLNFIKKGSQKPETPSYYAMDLTLSQKENLTKFFDAHHSNKVRFARKYVEICKSGSYQTPPWILIIRKIFTEY